MFAVIMTTLMALVTTGDVQSRPVLPTDEDKKPKLFDFLKKPEVALKENLSGVYAVTGVTFTANGQKKAYKSIVTFSKSNAPIEMYVVNWLTGSAHFTGRALRVGDKVSLSWPMGESIGTSLLTVNADGTLTGHWVSQSAVGEELFTPVQMPKNWLEYGSDKIRRLNEKKDDD